MKSNKKDMSLLVVGSIAFDSVQTPFGKKDMALGGSASYAAMAGSYFCNTRIVGVVGDDFPQANLDLFEQHNICSKGIEIIEGKTFFWKGVYNDLNIAETLDTQLNVFADFDPQIPKEYESSEYLFLGNIHPTLQLRVLEQIEKPKIVACDTMNFWIDGERELLLEVIKKVDILFINEEEIKMLTQEKNVFMAASKACKMGAQLIIIKRGQYGAMAIGEDMLFYSPIFPVRAVVDPTGAGDSFAGGFMGFLTSKGKINKKIIKHAMIYGTIAASHTVESFSLEKLQNTDMKQIETRKKIIRDSVVF